MALLPLQYIPLSARLAVAKLAAVVIDLADEAGADRWGLTPYADAIRVNVGWTEILTATPEFVRLVVDGERASLAMLPEGVSLNAGDDTRGFYPTVPGSRLAVIPYKTAFLEQTIKVLHPALVEAVRLAARRSAGRGVKAGHQQEAVSALESFLGRKLPALSYARDYEHDQLGPMIVNSALSNPEVVNDLDVESAEENDAALSARVAASLQLSSAERQARLEDAPKHSSRKRVWSNSFARNSDVIAEALYRANGFCDMCAAAAPFLRGGSGAPYLEVHHVKPLAEGGDDTVENAVACCPNCHRKEHYG